MSSSEKAIMNIATNSNENTWGIKNTSLIETKGCKLSETEIMSIVVSDSKPVCKPRSANTNSIMKLAKNKPIIPDNIETTVRVIYFGCDTGSSGWMLVIE